MYVYFSVKCVKETVKTEQQATDVCDLKKI